MTATIDETNSVYPAPRRRPLHLGHHLMPPAPPTTVAVIEGIATGSPGNVYHQADAATLVASMFADPVARERILRVYAKTKIDTRRLAVDPIGPEIAAVGADRSIRDRMNLFLEHAAPLAIDVAGRAMADSDANVDDIGLLVCVTSTGFIAPGVDIAVVKALGLPATVSRLVVNFMGCAAAMNGIRTGMDYVRANPDRKAMVICLELCSVNAVFDDDVNDVIIHSLFGDGCGALVIGARNVRAPLTAGKVVLRNGFSYLLDGAEDGIVLGVNADGITCDLAENLPAYIYDGVGPAIDDVLRRSGLTGADIDLWAIHPGGPKIIGESVRSLGLAPERAAVSWEVLARYGNMLSVSLIFVLERMIADVVAGGMPATGIAFSFAPGVTLEGVLFDIVAN